MYRVANRLEYQLGRYGIEVRADPCHHKQLSSQRNYSYELSVLFR
jgi:hypothetical protein